MTNSRLNFRRDRLAGWLLIAGSSSLLSYYALHHGSYSLTDRQQMAVLVWAGVGVAAAVGLLPRVRPARAVWLPFLALTALGLWTAIGMGWTESGERSFAEIARIVGYLGVLTLVWLTVGRANWRLVAAGLLVAGVLVCSLAVLSRFWPSLFPVDTVAKNLGVHRLSYPFGYWNAMGGWAAMSTTLCLAWAAHARSGVVRALALAAVPVCVLALYFTVSRAALGGAVLGPAVVVALGGYRWLTFGLTAVAGLASGLVVLVAREHQQLVQGFSSAGVGAVLPVLVLACAMCAAMAYTAHGFGLGDRLRMGPRAARRGLLVGGVVALLVAVVVLPSVARNAWDQFSEGNVAPAVAATPDARLVNLSGNRVNVWRSAWRAAEAHPGKGIGSGTFEFWWNRDGDNGEFLKDAHSIYLENLLELGVPGLLLLLAFLGGLAAAGVRGRAGLRSSGAIGVHAGLLGVFAVFLLQAGVDWIWESTAVTVLALVAVAVAAGAGSVPRDRGETSASAGVALLLVAVLAVVVQLPGLAGARALDQSETAFRGHEFQTAIERATSAIDAQPWAATPYGQRALAHEAAGELDAAMRDLEAAQQREQTNWRWALLAARVRSELGDAAGAASALEEAKLLRHHSGLLD